MTVMTPRRRPESPFRPLQNLAGTNTAQQIATVRKKQNPISVSTVETGPFPGTLPLAANELTLIQSVEKNAPTTGAKASEPHSSAACCRGETTGRAVNTGTAAAGDCGDAGAPSPRLTNRGLPLELLPLRLASAPRPTNSTSFAISIMLT